MSEEELTLGIGKLIVTAFLGLVLTIGGCSSYSTYQRAELIRAGVDPLTVRCGMDGNGSEPFCILRAAK